MTELHRLPHHDGSPFYAARRMHDGELHYEARIRVPRGYAALESVHVRFVIDGEPRFAPLERVEASAGSGDAEWWAGRFPLADRVVGYRFLLNHADGGSEWLCADGIDRLEPRDTRDFRATVFPDPPEWLASQVMYQVFPDRFARSAAAEARPAPDWARPTDWTAEVAATGPGTTTQLFGGDLDGIAERLDHLEALGVTLLYLTPFFPARSNHRYDASSFTHVDPLLGGDEALIRLVRAAHERGIRVIGDLTTNHTGAAHEWFTAALGDPAATEGDFYYWNDDAHTDYVAWYGVRSLPKLNWNSDELRRRFIDGPDSVVARWLLPPFELDGWRIDVANMTARLGADDLNRDVQRTVRRTMDEVAPGRVLFAESTNDANADFDGEGWHAPMSYSAFTRPVWQWLRSSGTDADHHFGIPYRTEPQYTAADVVDSYRRFAGSLPWSVQQAAMNAIDTHDTPRFAERAGDAEQLIAFGLAVTLPGTPVVFAGDEFGLRGVNGEHSRTPLPWAGGARLAESYARLTRLRAQSPAIQHGSLRWLHADDTGIAFAREAEGGAAVVLATSSATSIRIPRGALPPLGALTSVSDERATARQDGDDVVFEASGPALAVWNWATGDTAPEAADAAVLVGLDA